ncbi:hypothetical protein V3C99_011671 [Haemonchus contortus]|nr:Epidermal growth factor receptor substrate [Haemonchus contortus]
MADLAQIVGLHGQAYETCFREANPANNPTVPAGEAAAFLKRSNLNVQQLGQIWELADYQKKGALDKKGFFIAFKLVAAAQQGFPISPASIGLPNLHPPHFEGVSDKNFGASAQPFSHNGSMPSHATEWCINAADQAKYDSIFESLSPIDGKLPGAKVRPVLLNSGLNPTILAKIWELADQDKDGQLDRIEMTVAMHLVYRALQNEPVPAVLPNNLIHPSKMSLTRRTSTASVTSVHGGSGPHNFPMPPPSQFNPSQANYRSRTGSMTSLDGVGHTTRPPPVENRSASVQPNQGPRNESAPATPIRGMGGQLSMSVGSSSNSSLEWPVDRLASAAQFAACDTDSDGFVNGNDVKHVLLGSGLPQQALAHIWALCDINRTGKLNQEQFALIIHLVNMRKRGEELPTTLPQFLIPPSLRVLTVTENEHHVTADSNAAPTEHVSGSDSGEMRRLAEEMEKLLVDRREADAQVSQLEADMKVKDSQIKNLQVELRTLEVTVKQLERQKTEAGRRLGDLDEQIRQLEAAALAQAKKAEDAQTRLNQLVEDTQKDAAHAEADLQEIAQLKAELAQLEVERLNLTSQLSREQKGMETAVDRITEVERKRQRDEAQRVQLNEAIAHAENIVNDLQTVLKSADPTTALSAKLNLLEDISRKDLFNDVPFSVASTSKQAVQQPPDPFIGVQTGNVQHVDPFAQTDPFAAAAASGTFATQFPQDPFGGTAAVGGPPIGTTGIMPPGPSIGASKAPPPRPAPPKSSARQTPVNGDPFANTDPFASDSTTAGTTTGGFADFSSFGAF